MIDRRPPARWLPIGAVCLVAAGALVACDTGDGTTLKDPTAPTTLPPPPTQTLESVPIGSAEPGADAASAVTESTAAVATTPAETPSAFELFAPWADGGVIDARYTCDGIGVSPPLSWAGAPRDAVEVVIALEDESDTSRGRPFVHWVIGGIDVADGALAEGDVPVGAIQGLNFFGDVGYGPPCPPPDDEPHVFRITLYALNQQLEAADGTPAAELIDLVESFSLGSSSRAGLAQR